MNQLSIICHNSGDIIINALEASKIIMQSNVIMIFAIGGIILSVMGPFIGLSAKDSNTSASANMSAALLSQTWSRVVLMILFLVICFPSSYIPNGILTKTVLVEDRSNQFLSGTVEDVPLVICIFGSIISIIGDELSSMVETAYQNPTTYPTTYRESGIGYPLRVFKETQRIEFPMGKIKTDALNYTLKCVMPEIIGEESEGLNLLNSTDLLSYYDNPKFKSNARYVNVCNDMNCSSVTLITCFNMYNQFQSTVNNNLNLIKTNIAKSTGIGWRDTGINHDLDKFSNSVEELYQFLFYPPISGDTAIVNSCLINVFLESVDNWEKLYDATPSLSQASNLHAERSLESQLQLKESIWSKRFVKIRAIYEGGLYLISPILIILAITRANFQIFFIICGLNLSLALIDPIYAIINQNILAKLESISSLNYAANYINIREVAPIINQDLTLVNYITSSVMILSAWIVSQVGGTSSFKGVGSSEMDGAAKGGASIEGSGSYSFDNISMGNKSLYQENLSPSVVKTIKSDSGIGTYKTYGNHLAGSSGSPFAGNNGHYDFSGMTNSGNLVRSTGLMTNSGILPRISNITSAGSVNTGYTAELYSSNGYNDVKQHSKTFGQAWNALKSNSSTISYTNQLNAVENDNYNRNMQTTKSHRDSESISGSQTEAWAKSVLESVSGSETWDASKRAAAMNYISGSGGLKAGRNLGIPGVESLLGASLDSGLVKRVSSNQAEGLTKKLDSAVQNSIKNDEGGQWSRAKSEILDEVNSKSSGFSLGASYAHALSHLSQDSNIRNLSFQAQKSLQGIETAQNSIQSGNRVSISGDKAFSDLTDGHIKYINDTIKNKGSGDLKAMYSNFVGKATNSTDQKVALTETLSNLLSLGKNYEAQELLDITSESGGKHASSMFVMANNTNVGGSDVNEKFNSLNQETVDLWNDQRSEVNHSFEDSRNNIINGMEGIRQRTQQGKTIYNNIGGMNEPEIKKFYESMKNDDLSQLDNFRKSKQKEVQDFSSMDVNKNVFQNTSESFKDDWRETKEVLKKGNENFEKNMKDTIQYKIYDSVKPTSTTQKDS